MLYYVKPDQLANAITAIKEAGIVGYKITAVDVTSEGDPGMKIASEKCIIIDLCPTATKTTGRLTSGQKPAVELVLTKTLRALLNCYGKVG